MEKVVRIDHVGVMLRELGKDSSIRGMLVVTFDEEGIPTLSVTTNMSLAEINMALDTLKFKLMELL